MKLLVKDFLISMVMGLVLPGILLNFGVELLRQHRAPEVATATETVADPAAVEVKLRGEDGTVTMDMDDYLEGVLLAEMPVWFEGEALKAQAVVARTYARKAFVTGGKHGDGSVCTQASCCQGYLLPEEYQGAEDDVRKIRNAVLETSGQVLTYGEELIEATYFSCSGGSTEDAVAVWGTEVPYLQAVASPGEEAAAYYRDSVQIPKAELETQLGIELTGDAEDWVGEMALTDGGGVASIRIGGMEFTGVSLRKLLGLRSASFEVEPGENSLIFTTKGYGHRVGMSQYGADAMAAAGSGYGEILTHYYQGAELVRISP